MTGEFIERVASAIDRDQFAVVLNSGVALISDEAVQLLTGGAIKAPAAALVIGAIGADGKATHQLLISVFSAAALEGSLRGWSELLPVDQRDQYEALARDSHEKWVAIAREHLSGEAQ